MITLNNKFTVTSTDSTATMPGDGIISNFTDTSNDAVLKLFRTVPEMASGQTDWLASIPLQLIDLTLLGSPSKVDYLALKTSMPIYVWFELPTLVPGVGGIDTPLHIEVHRMLVVDGGVTTLYALNPAAYDSRKNDATVEMFLCFTRP